MKEIALLEKMHACKDAINWLENQPSYKQAWQKCERGDWMLWLLRKKLSIENEQELRRLTLAKARCAKLVLHLMKDERSKKAVEIAEKFGQGKASREELDAAVIAADAADAITIYGADATANADTLRKCADIVRKLYPEPPELD